jgi:hypothetical protein
MFTFDPYFNLSVHDQRSRGLRERAARYTLARRTRGRTRTEEGARPGRADRRSNAAGDP